MNFQIDNIDARNLLALLERVQISAREVDVFVGVRSKLLNIANPPKPVPVEAVDVPQAQPAPVPDGVPAPGVTSLHHDPAPIED